MDHSMIFSLKFLLWARLFVVVVSLPTLGYVDRHRLETYEDFSEERLGDLDFFNNLTFRFSCEGKPIGLYADLEYDCRIFHACDDSGKGFPVVCPNDTFFDQRERVCSDEEHVDCEHANEWFYLNELPFSVEETEENHARTEEKEEVPSVLPLLLQ
ncbi:U-scoloptoxin(01)-Er1a [Apis florea]|uniref:U-scoloptoxin(01)-Er1a n=1 Tax=Apis florea TaxID=7463 RepID=UPI0006296862|nr:U-scoloptoxin(01)-Er1a [Apis florea]